MRTCKQCGEEKDESDYYVGSTPCKKCCIKNSRDRQLRDNYGLTTKDYSEMLEAQDGKCAICGATENNNKRMKYFCVDHDHSTGKVRDLLCQECNFFLGKLEKKLPIIDKFLDYLRKHEQ